jgi:hypothetical protein
MSEGRPPGPAAVRSRLALPIPIYPIILTVAFVVELFVVSGVSPFPVLRTLALAVIVSLVVTVVARLVMGDRHRGGFVAALTTLAVLAGADLRIAAILTILIAALLLERFVLPEARRTIRWHRVSALASRLVAVMVLAVAIHAVQSGTPAVIVRAVGQEAMRPPVTTTPVDATDPDIYMILLDGYARKDVLQEIFSMEGATLADRLEERDFEVASRSRSNYMLTAQVLGSMLNLRHLVDQPRMAGVLAGNPSQPTSVIVRDVLNQNAVFETLRGRGYWIEALSSGFEEVAFREADRFIDSGDINEFEIGMLRRTLLGDMARLIAPGFASGQQRHRIEHILRATSDGSSRPTARPMFVFSHLPIPHPPWVYHADGSPRDIADPEAFYGDTPATTGEPIAQLTKEYADAVRDLDVRVLAMLDDLDATIQARGRPAVTIVFSDHGSWIGADGGDLSLRFKNLLAIRSNSENVTLPDDQTLINLFPALFEQLYGIHVDRQPDTLYRFDGTDEFALTPADDPDAVLSP